MWETTYKEKKVTYKGQKDAYDQMLIIEIICNNMYRTGTVLKIVDKSKI